MYNLACDSVIWCSTTGCLGQAIRRYLWSTSDTPASSHRTMCQAPAGNTQACFQNFSVFAKRPHNKRMPLFSSPGEILAFAAQQGLTYYVARRIMLRGSKNLPRSVVNRPYRGKGENYQYQQLQRQIRSLKPSIENVATSYAHTATPGITLFQQYLTNDLKVDALYPDIVLGDKFNNISLSYNTFCNAAILKLRVIIYWSKKTGTIFTPAATALGWTQQADPAAFTVVKDTTYIPSFSASGMAPKFRVSLGNKLSIINRSSSTIESGELHVSILAESTGTSGLSMTARHYIRNK